MSPPVIIGGGHNGLVAAYYLARAGLKPIVFERRSGIGGGAVTAEIHPGFHCPALSHEVLLHARIAREMDLARHGLELIAPDADVCALPAAGPPLVLYGDVARSVESLKTVVSTTDAEAYGAYRQTVERIVSVLASTFEIPPPDIDRPDTRDLWNLLQAGRGFKALARRDAYRLLRWGPMAVADLVREWFEHELLRAAIAAPALSGTMLGPRSAGSALILLMREAHRQLAGGRPLRARGGPGAVTRALASAARAAGADIRTGAPVERILLERGRVAAVVAGGQEVRVSRVVSAADPRTTFALVDPAELTPDFAAKIRNYRASGTLAKVNLALARLPALDVDRQALSGRIHIGPELDYLERAFDYAKYGEFSAAPWLEMTIPSIADPGLAPAGAHVASIYVHYAPYRLRGDWNEARDRLLAATFDVLERHAPGIRGDVVAAQVITPVELERTYGFAGGHIFHGELALDQLFTMRPLLGFARYATPIPGLFMCSGGTHPGGFLTGASGRLAAREVLRTRHI